MSGKPNLPNDFVDRPEIHGASETAPGWDALDEQRAASMTDEGGNAQLRKRQGQTGILEAKVPEFALHKGCNR